MLRRIFLTCSLVYLLGLLAFSGASAADPSASTPKNILIDNFEDASMKDLLGGYIGSDTAAPGVCRFSYTWSQQDTFGKATHSLRVDYDVRPRGSFTYLWFHLGPEGADKKVRTADLSGLAYLSFWVKSAGRGGDFKIELHCDTNQSGRYDPGEDASSEVYIDRYLGKTGLTDEWRKVVIPLADFKKITDFSHVMEIVFVFENLRGNRQGTIFLDELLLGGKKIPKPSAGSAGLPTPTTLVPPDAARNGAMTTLNCGASNCLAARQYPSDALEGTGFEISWDEGRSWTLAGIDYGAKEIAMVPWKTPALPPSRKVLLRAFAQGIDGRRAHDANTMEIALTGYSDAELIEELARRAFLYFLNNQNPDTGLFLDSAGGDASTAVSGFGLAALTIGAKERWMDQEEARARVLKTLRTYDLLQHTKVPGNGSEGGFFYHFMKPASAERSKSSEVSVVDTALLLLGALTAGEYFGGEVDRLSRGIYDAVRWDNFYDAQTRSFRMAWTPEKGYFSTHWDYYTDEAVLIYILAAGSTTHPTPADSFYTFRREKGHCGDGEDFIYSWSGALFTHQYTAAWLDIQGMEDRQGCDWWENSRKAVAANRDFCWFNKDRPVAYGPHHWGVSSFHRPEGYVMHFGVPPSGSGEAQEDGTISPIACAASITFLPFEAMNDLKHQMAAFPFLMSSFGLRNAYNLARNWFSNVDFGLDTGLLLLSLENFRSETVWKALGKSPVIRRGLAACGFKRVSRAPVFPALTLPQVPERAPAGLAQAQEWLQSLERLCLRLDKKAYEDFIRRSEKEYAKASVLLEGLQAGSRGVSAATLFHCEWLKSLMAIRQASIISMRRHLGKMLQRLQDLSGTPFQRAIFLRPYLAYVALADLRDFQEAMYAAFKKDVGKDEKGIAQLEAFAQQCQQARRFALAERSWSDALDLRRDQGSAQAVGNRAREIAEGFLKVGRLEEAVAFDRQFLKEITPTGNTREISMIVELGRKYEAAGATGFSKECYAAIANVSAKKDSGKVLTRAAAE